MTIIEELGNPSDEKSQDLLVLDTMEIIDPAVARTVCNTKYWSASFDSFTKECLIDRT